MTLVPVSESQKNVVILRMNLKMTLVTGNFPMFFQADFVQSSTGVLF